MGYWLICHRFTWAGRIVGRIIIAQKDTDVLDSWTPNSLDWSKRVLQIDVTTWASETTKPWTVNQSCAIRRARDLFCTISPRAACLPRKLTLSLGSLYSMYAQTTVTTCCYRLINRLESTRSLRINVQQDCGCLRVENQ